MNRSRHGLFDRSDGTKEFMRPGNDFPEHMNRASHAPIDVVVGATSLIRSGSRLPPRMTSIGTPPIEFARGAKNRSGAAIDRCHASMAFMREGNAFP